MGVPLKRPNLCPHSWPPVPLRPTRRRCWPRPLPRPRRHLHPLQPLSSPTPTAEPKIIVIGDTEKQQVQVGEIFIVQGSRGPNWQIGYDPEVLELLTTAEEQQTAGDTWLFMAIQATTQTVIRLDFSSPPCTAEPCPPPPGGAAILMEAFIEITQP